MKAYLAILRGTVLESLAYRLGFLFMIIGNLVYLTVTYYLWKSIYQNSATIHNLSFNDTYIYIASGSTMFVLLKTFADWQIAHEIQDGTISVYLAKPIDYQLYSMAVSLGAALTNMIIISIPTILVLIFVFQVQFSMGPGLLVLPISMLLAFMIGFCFDYVTGLTAFYTESVWGISTTKEILISIMAGGLIPLQFFPAEIQKVLLVLPFQSIYYTPLMMITRPNQSWETLAGMLATQAFWVVALYLITRLVYSQAIKVLRIAGG